MQTKSPFFDQAAKAMEQAMGIAQTAGEEARAAFRAQADRWAADLDLVRRDEFDAMRATLQAEIAELRVQMAALHSPDASGAARPSDDAG